MYATFHLSSAEEVTTDILETIRATFKSKPITITVEEEVDTTAYLMSSPRQHGYARKIYCPG